MIASKSIIARLRHPRGRARLQRVTICTKMCDQVRDRQVHIGRLIVGRCRVIPAVGCGEHSRLRARYGRGGAPLDARGGHALRCRALQRRLALGGQTRRRRSAVRLARGGRRVLALGGRRDALEREQALHDHRGVLRVEEIDGLDADAPAVDRYVSVVQTPSPIVARCRSYRTPFLLPRSSCAPRCRYFSVVKTPNPDMARHLYSLEAVVLLDAVIFQRLRRLTICGTLSLLPRSSCAPRCRARGSRAGTVRCSRAGDTHTSSRAVTAAAPTDTVAHRTLGRRGSNTQRDARRTCANGLFGLSDAFCVGTSPGRSVFATAQRTVPSRSHAMNGP